MATDQIADEALGHALGLVEAASLVFGPLSTKASKGSLQALGADAPLPLPGPVDLGTTSWSDRTQVDRLVDELKATAALLQSLEGTADAAATITELADAFDELPTPEKLTSQRVGSPEAIEVLLRVDDGRADDLDVELILERLPEIRNLRRDGSLGAPEDQPALGDFRRVRLADHTGQDDQLPRLRLSRIVPDRTGKPVYVTAATAGADSPFSLTATRRTEATGLPAVITLSGGNVHYVSERRSHEDGLEKLFAYWRRRLEEDLGDAAITDGGDLGLGDGARLVFIDGLTDEQRDQLRDGWVATTDERTFLGDRATTPYYHYSASARLLL